MIEIFPWSALLETGIAKIDEQHRRLVDLLNQLAAQYVDGEEAATTGDILDGLADYAVYHFATEEKIWHGSMPAEAICSHKSNHADFTGKIVELQQRYRHSPALEHDLFGFLTEWLIYHILDTDRTMAWVALGIEGGLPYEEAEAMADERRRGDDGRMAHIIMSLYRRMTTQTLDLMREREEHLRGERQRHASEQSRLRDDLLRAQRVGRVGSWRYDPIGDQIECSQEACRLYGIDPLGRLTLDSFFDVIWHEDRQRIESARRAAQNGEAYNVEYRTADSTGSCWVHEVAEFLTDADGAMTTALGTVQDITDRKHYEQRLELLAFTDPLTGLPNRHAFTQSLEHRLQQHCRNADAAYRQSGAVSLYILDIDDMGQVNNSMGDAVGDELLRTVAKRLESQADSGDLVARLGGDKFAYVSCIPDDSDKAAKRQSELQELMELPITIGNDTIHITASIGYLYNSGGHIREAGPLLRMAEQAIYRAKLAGRRRAAEFDLAQYHTERSRQARLEELRLALRERQFTLFYQPKIDLFSGELTGLEALIRWQQPEQGLLLPDTFIPELEGHPLMVEIGEWVIGSALEQQLAWQQLGLTATISVNVTSIQLDQPDFVERLMAQFTLSAALQPARFEVEVVETGPMFDLGRASDSFQLLKKAGVRIALDDFGTGHSSLQSLNLLRPQTLKIDRSFVLGILDDSNSRAIVQAVLDLGRTFGIDVVAEGVETPHHARELIGLGCRFAQGYAIARPMPAPELMEWLVSWRAELPEWIGG